MMLGKSSTSKTDASQVEELRSAISSYKSMIQKVENSKLKNLNKSFNENIRKDLRSREDVRLHNSKNLILPSITTLNLPNFYDFLLKLARYHKVALNIIPTLFLPKPGIFLFTDPNGKIEVFDKQSAFEQFFKYLSKAERVPNTPLCIFKGSNKKIKLFSDIDQVKVFIKQHKGLSGQLQEFILQPSDRTSLCRVLWKQKKFRYVLLINKHPYKQRGVEGRSRSASCSIGGKRTEESFLFENMWNRGKKEKTEEIQLQKLINTPGILNRIQAKVTNPWKQKSAIKFYLDPIQSEKFLLNSTNLDDCYINNLTTTFPELEQMMLTISTSLTKHLFHDKIEITELVCEFLKDPNKNWKLLSTPLVKIKHVDWAEIVYNSSVEYHNLKINYESEPEPNDDTTVRYEDKIEVSEVHQALSRQHSMKSQFSFKPESNTFQDRFKKTIMKIDRIRKRDRINANVGLSYELVQNYRSKLKIDKEGNVSPVMLHNSPGVLKTRTNIFSQLAKPDLMSCLHSTSKCYDKFNSAGTIAMYTKKIVESYESTIKEIQQKKFQTIKLDEKYGGKKFILNFTTALVSRLSSTAVSKFLCMNDLNEAVFCPGLELIFDCKVNLALAKILHCKHVNLKISKEDYDVFTEAFLGSLKEFEFSVEDFEYMDELLRRLSRDIYVKQTRKDKIN